MSAPDVSNLVKEIVKEMDANDFYSRVEAYDGTNEESWFRIELMQTPEEEGASAEARASLRKPWSEFQRLHNLLLMDEFGFNDDVKKRLPDLPSMGGANDDRSTSCEEAVSLGSYLNSLLAIPLVVQSQVFSGFLDESHRCSMTPPNGPDAGNRRGPVARSSSCIGLNESGADGTRVGSSPKDVDREGLPKSPGTAIDFLLQPFDYTNAYIPRRQSHSARIHVIRGESVVWKFEIMDLLDINFSVVFRPHAVAVPHSNPFDPGSSGEIARPTENPVPEWIISEDTQNGDYSTGSNCADRHLDNRQRSRSWWGLVKGTESSTNRHAKCQSSKQAVAEQVVHLPTRYSTDGRDPVQGSFACPADGTCILLWDNSYSRLRGKRLSFVVESVTAQTMRAAIEAAGAVDHKRRSKRSHAAQTILDSGVGRMHVRVTAARDIEEDLDPDDARGDGGDRDGFSGNSVTDPSSNDFYSGSGGYRLGRIRRIAAALLRDLGTIIDARQGDDDESTTETAGEPNHDVTIDGDGGTRSKEVRKRGGVDAEGVDKLVAKFVLLEDEVASVSARRAQSEAQAKVLLATLQKANTRADRLERTLEETLDELKDARGLLNESDTERNEAVAAVTTVTARLQTSEEQLLRAKREGDLLQAERSVWQVARSGIQDELAKVVAELEKERHQLEDANQALSKSHESRAHAEAEAAQLSRRLEEERGGVGGIRQALANEREALRLAREEAEDARAAVAEMDAAVAELAAQKRVLVAGLRSRERALGDRCSAAEARAEEAAMMRRAAETRVRELEDDVERREAAQADLEIHLQRVRAEKKVLLAEIRRAGGRGGQGEAAGGETGAGIPTASAGSNPSAAATTTAKPRASAGSVGDESEARRSLHPVDADHVKEAKPAAGDGKCTSMGSPTSSSSESSPDPKAMLKQLSKQLVHLRERQHHLREDLKCDAENASAQRLSSDVDRAVKKLESRIRRLLRTVAAGESTVPPRDASQSPPGQAKGLTPPAEVERYSV